MKPGCRPPLKYDTRFLPHMARVGPENYNIIKINNHLHIAFINHINNSLLKVGRGISKAKPQS